MVVCISEENHRVLQDCSIILRQEAILILEKLFHWNKKHIIKSLPQFNIP